MASPRQERYGYHRSNTHPNHPPRQYWDNINYPVDSSQRARVEGTLPSYLPELALSNLPSPGESWVEISSQPSSSSLSSIDNEIITTGLRVQPLDLRRHRRNTTQRATRTPQAVARAASSQDEYDESSSEEDNVLTGTTDGIHLRTGNGGRLSPRQAMSGLGRLVADSVRFPSPSKDDDEEEDEDEEGTALGITQPEAMFTPQPRRLGEGTEVTTQGTYRETQRDSYFPPNSHAQRFRESSHRAANDAALRASLTTLLSCAQAARSLPKPYNGPPPVQRGGNELEQFRILPESQLPGVATGAPVTTTQAQTSPRPSNSTRPRSSATASADEKEKAKEKRKSTTPSSKPKKKRPSTHVHSTENGAQVHQVLTHTVSPTLLTWIVSAGVVVFVSVVGFGAGYAMGFEAGKEEGKLLVCGREVPVRVRRFRWGTAT